MLRGSVLGVASIVVAAGCMGPGVPGQQSDAGDVIPATAIASQHLSPGLFRDTLATLIATEAMSTLDAHATLLHFSATRLAEPGDLPSMNAATHDTLAGLLLLNHDAMHATADVPFKSTAIGKELLTLTLGLDPALLALNQDQTSYQLPTTEAHARTLAAAARSALAWAAYSYPDHCATSATAAATFDPGQSETLWVEEQCTEGQWVGVDCSDDQYVDGECWDEWVPEDCSDGYWYDNGYWEYYCWDENDCYTRWYEVWIWIPGSCSGGCWQETCSGGSWQAGGCADEIWVEGQCTPAHWEERYADAAWQLDFSAMALAECAPVRAAQYAIAGTVATVLRAKGADTLDPAWVAALDALLETDEQARASEAFFDAVLQIVISVSP